MAEQNLIQVQTELQSPAVRDEDLIKYANGSNPSVPSFLALMEMNRRKQLAEGAKAYEASNQKTIKDQLSNALTAPTLAGAPANQIDPTKAPTGISMGAAPANQVNPTIAPPMPKSAPITVGAAEGGLMSLPVAHFSANSYAGGGIVAFGDPKRNPDEEQLVSFPEARSSGPKVLSDSQVEAALRAQTEPAAAAPAAPAKGYQGILDSLPKIQAPSEKSLEELYADRKAAERLAGVSEDPYADVKKRMQATEERQKKENEGAGLDRLLAQLSAFSKADPSKGFGYAAGVSADASMALEKEQRALVEKQEAAQTEFAKAIAKEEDARRHKDADGVLAAQQAQQKAALDFQKAQHDAGMLAAHIYQTDEYAKMRRDAAAQSAANKPDPDDVLYNRLMAKADMDSTYKMLVKKQEFLSPGDPQYNYLEKQKHKLLKEKYFAKRPDLLPPEPSDTVPYKEATEPGWWDRNAPAFLGGSPTVSFDQLPK